MPTLIELTNADSETAIFFRGLIELKPYRHLLTRVLDCLFLLHILQTISLYFQQLYRTNYSSSSVNIFQFLTFIIRSSSFFKFVKIDILGTEEILHFKSYNKHPHYSDYLNLHNSEF